MKKQEDAIIPENIRLINGGFFYCINDLIFKGNRSEIYSGKKDLNYIPISSSSSYISKPPKKSNDSNNLISKSQSEIEENQNQENLFQISLYCIKKEPPFLKHPQLYKEYSILNYLQKYITDKNFSFIPKLYKFYPNEESDSFLITELLGTSVEKLFEFTKKKFPPLVSLEIISKIMDVIEKLHEIGIIHRNLNPSHFLFNKENTADIFNNAIVQKEIVIDIKSNNLYLIDYADAIFYLSDPNMDFKENHIEFSDKVQNYLNTNENFCSMWAELKMEQSRRDDLYSIFYMLIYLMTGNLPWLNIKAKDNKHKRNKIRDKKLTLSSFELCKNFNKLIEEEVVSFVDYISGLTFNDKPNYKYLNYLLEKMKEKFRKSKNEEDTIDYIRIIN